jgi:hypothetical protein
MYVKWIPIILIVASPMIGYSQGCPNSDFPSYYNCSDLAQFVNDYPDCSRLPSTLRLPYDGGDLTNYPGLEQIDSISGNLTCDECEVSSLLGLENLTFVGGHVTIDEPHAVLENLYGLTGLSYIGGGLRLWECSDLISTNGLDNLFHVDRINISECTVLNEIVGLEEIETLNGGLILEENHGMETLVGFESIVHVGADVEISDNDGLTSLQGLNNLQTVAGELRVEDNPALVNLDGLYSLNSIGGLRIAWNDGLENLEGLSSALNCSGAITIRDNPLLQSLHGLENIAPTGIMDLQVYDCELLTLCSVESVCSYLSESLGPSTIASNENGCNSQEEILEACDEESVHVMHLMETSRRLVKMVDITGRILYEYDNPAYHQTNVRASQLLILVYDDGTAEKTFALE